MASFEFGGLVEQITATATSGGTTTLTNTSTQVQIFTGSASHTVVLPDCTTMARGQKFEIYNQSSSSINLQNTDTTPFLGSGNPSLHYGTIPSNSYIIIKLSNSGSTTGSWASLSSVPSALLQSANTVYSGPSSGSAAAPTFRSLVGADLPNPSATTLGGVESLAAVTSKWINTISTSGVPSATQPAFTDISGSVAAGQMPALTGDVTSTAGTVATTVAKIQGTAVSGTTGTGNVAFSASPTFTGTIVAAAANFSGAISASNFSGSSSGTNTGDQTITLTGNVTGSGTGSFVATIAAGAVTLAKMANLAADSIIGNNTGSSATPIALTTAQVRALISVAPTVQTFLSGSGTYTTPTSPAPLYIEVEMVGGGGGGSGSGTATGTVAGDGGNTTFGTSLLVANGGAHGIFNGSQSAGGSASLGSGPLGIAISGGYGEGGGKQVTISTMQLPGGQGGSSAFGGAGGGGQISGATGTAGSTNTGGGGGGGSMENSANAFSGNGGGSGGYVRAIITSPAATYAYSIGAAGSAGGAGTGGFAGGAGGSGIIVVWEYYQ